ncbi:DinB family protein [Bacillus sp. T33-2]|uniref:DinB family protein n=1 Tax=Bacillus sp. T33-2 TaxID=2054168 RepID=UPI000C76E846|nr:DinB family protein [Bacillus sp. T33-2]PLR92858.1 hypothetical protein CVD19_19900 [Bacillus sp. T33-2]
MNKEKIIAEKVKLAEWADTLKSLSEDVWFKPLKDGSWGTADVISHFISWDQFIIDYRISYLLKDESFPSVPVDVEEMNKKASDYARAGILKDDLIDEFVSVRERLVSHLEQIPDALFDQPCPGKEHLTVKEYFSGMIEHDQKHKEQIDSFLKEQIN